MVIFKFAFFTNFLQKYFATSASSRHFRKKVFCLAAYSSERSYSKMKGLVLGVFTKSSSQQKEYSAFTKAFKDVDEKCKGKLTTLLKNTGPFYKSTNSRTFWVPSFKEAGDNLSCDCIVIVDVGAENANENTKEDRDVVAENIRCAIAVGINVLKSSSQFEQIYLDDCGKPRAVAESANLTIFSYDELKQESSHKQKIDLQLYKYDKISSEVISEFEKGTILGECQNFSRYLQEKPANLLTPTIFANTVQEKVKDKNVQVHIRDKVWIESMKMGSFLSVAKGSPEEPKFLELHYNGAPDIDKCIAFVGKGITFDSGGVSLKPPAAMGQMRSDMGGAACAVAAFYGASSLGLKINLKVFTPLTENMIDGCATKPADVIFAMNGISIQVDNTDAEGRLVLCDALTYAQQFKPAALLDFATLTGAVRIALGAGCAGVYSNDDDLWQQFHDAGTITGDRVWRMPLFKHYTRCMTTCQLADINNTPRNGNGGSCTAAAFLQEFVDSDVKWLHADISGVKEKADYNAPYLCNDFSGRPTRTIIQFLETAAENFSKF